MTFGDCEYWDDGPTVAHELEGETLCGFIFRIVDSVQSGLVFSKCELTSWKVDEDQEEGTEVNQDGEQDEGDQGDWNDNGEAEWDGDDYRAPLDASEDLVNSMVVTSHAFEYFGQQLKACQPTTDLSIDWRLSPSNDVVMHYQEEGSINLVVESLKIGRAHV